ncbi:type II toxin-antitoxin system RelE/ParE family toxin [Vineibacter terrae]|uniref:type II toxin-antitoxin system RelE/ParE family toxin n=1 Tax=Vineibacter terrae TaxID=2586908 RepID=UPI002E2ED04F|nr:type II toxin-antitoxin system RelE/ParE family toxin [Vineibacter terrae]HEX2892124.1 type II toxin-antitoxin system RelE/ParE family toxin [Vineibacter terrae]
MVELRQTDEFTAWHQSLRDDRAKAKIAARLLRMSMGNLGDCKTYGEISEARIDYGPGYRLYFVRRGNALIILLCGGDKRTQDKDFRRARELAGQY